MMNCNDMVALYVIILSIIGIIYFSWKEYIWNKKYFPIIKELILEKFQLDAELTKLEINKK